MVRQVPTRFSSGSVAAALCSPRQTTFPVSPAIEQRDLDSVTPQGCLGLPICSQFMPGAENTGLVRMAAVRAPGTLHSKSLQLGQRFQGMAVRSVQGQ